MVFLEIWNRIAEKVNLLIDCLYVCAVPFVHSKIKKLEVIFVNKNLLF